ncbi:MAG: hypothetical protein LUF04_11975 [Bacteroides sp.]|nr:hypothetical protein [Bacteroides sp.]
MNDKGYLHSSSLIAMDQGAGLSAELAKKVDKTIAVTAGTGLTGGGALSQNLTLALATSGVSSGTYPKVTVDTYGRVTAGTSLVAADIPTLGISKITNLESTLEKKMERADFDELFEKVNIGTSAHPVWAIRAKLGLYSDSFLSASGLNDASGSAKDYLLLEDWDRYDGSKSDFVLSAFLGYDLHTRVLSLEDKAVTVKESGAGNAYTSFRYDSNVLTLVKGADFLTSSQLTGYATESWVDSRGYLTASSAASTYVTLATAQTITGAKTFSGTTTFSSFVRPPFVSSTWLATATTTACFEPLSWVSSSTACHVLYRIRTYSGHSVAFHGYGNQVGFHGVAKTNIDSSTNSTSFRTYWEPESGLLRHSSTLSVGGTATFDSTMTVAAQFYGKSSIYSGGKTSTIDGAAGACLTNTGNLYLSHASTPTIFFHYANTTATSTYILGDANGGIRIQPRVGIGISSNSSYALYVNGATYLSGALTVAGALNATGNTTIGGTVTVSGLGTFSKNLQTSEYIQIGTILIQYDKENNGLKVVGAGGEAAGLYTTSYLSAVGIGSISSGGGGLIENVYRVTDFGKSFNELDSNNTFNAHAINSLYNRVVSLEGKAITVAQSGTGNAYTSFTYTNNTLTLVKGATYATTTALSSYVLKTGDTMTGTLSNSLSGSTSARFRVTGYTGTSWGTGAGALGVAITNNTSQTPLIVGYRNTAADNATGTDRVFSMELLNAGTSLRLYFNGVNHYAFASTTTTTTLFLGPGKTSAADGIGGHVFYSSSGRHYLQSGTSGTNPGLDFYQYGETARDAYLVNSNGGLYTARFGVGTMPSSAFAFQAYGLSRIYGGNFIIGESSKSGGNDGYSGIYHQYSTGRTYNTGSSSTSSGIWFYQYGGVSALGSIYVESATDSSARLTFAATNGLYTTARWFSTAPFAFTLNYSTATPATHIYKDASNFYILLSNAGDAANYNNLRPFYINLTTGKVNINTDFQATGTTQISTLNATGTSSHTGVATFSSFIRPPFVSSTWLATSTTTACIEPASWVISSTAQHMLYRVRTYSGHAVGFGAYGDTAGFNGITITNINAGTNSNSFRTYWTPSSGLLTHTAAFTVTGAVTFSSTLAVSGTTTAAAINAYNVSPRSSATYTLGTSSVIWNYLYVNHIIASGTSILTGAVTVRSTLTTSAQIYSGSSIYSGGKTGTADGKAGTCLTNTGNLYLSNAAGPAVFFQYANTTAATTYIAGTSDGGIRLQPRVGIAIAPSTSYVLYVGGATSITGAVTMSSSATISGNVHITSAINSSSTVSDASLKISGGIAIAKDLWAANVFSTGAVTAQTTSDRNAKYDFQAFDACQVLLALGQVMRFRYKETHQEAIGPVYQDVVGVLPQMDARRKGDRYGSLNYLHPDYINLIAASCQQTIQKVETIRERVDRLERENGELKQQIEQLKHTYHAGK